MKKNEPNDAVRNGFCAKDKGHIESSLSWITQFTQQICNMLEDKKPLNNINNNLDEQKKTVFVNSLTIFVSLLSQWIVNLFVKYENFVL